MRGYKQFLYSKTGRVYLDTVNNVPHVGHQHPRVVEAAQAQIALLNTNTRYLHNTIVDYAEQLLNKFPAELKVIHFVNSGSEANELAMRMLRAYTGQRDMLAVETGYHGNTGGCIDISSYKFDGKGGRGKPEYTHLMDMPDSFRGAFSNKPQAMTDSLRKLEDTISSLKRKGRNLGGFICESMLSCGGQIVLPDNYLSSIYKIIHREGGLCIADEVQVGFGRLGEKFWGFELQEVTPDIVVLGKPMGNGHPLAAVVCTEDVASAFANGMEYFNTFGGNPVSCAIGKEVLNVIEDEQLQQNAMETGAYMKEGIKSS